MTTELVHPLYHVPNLRQVVHTSATRFETKNLMSDAIRHYPSWRQMTHEGLVEKKRTAPTMYQLYMAGQLVQRSPRGKPRITPVENQISGAATVGQGSGGSRATRLRFSNRASLTRACCQ